MWNSLAAASGHKGAIKNRDMDAKLLPPQPMNQNRCGSRYLNENTEIVSWFMGTGSLLLWRYQQG